jgi:hypothetical protein
VLAAEITATRTFIVKPDYAALRATGKPYGIALRIGPGANATPEFAASLLADSNASELQIDFDCAEARLDAYLQWLIPTLWPRPDYLMKMPLAR